MTLPGPAFARRSLLLAGLGAALSTAPPASALPPRAVQFPRDHGSHPDARTEWWYATGWLGSEAAPFDRCRQPPGMPRDGP